MKNSTLKISCLLIAWMLSTDRLFAQCAGEVKNIINYGVCNPDPWLLVFEDNFDGTTLDLNKWKLKEDAQGSLNTDPSHVYYSLDNVTVSGGTCYINAKQETVVRKAVNWKPDGEILSDGLANYPRTYNYTSGWIETKNRFNYGKFEIRCKIPWGKGLWPAFWMFGQPLGPKDEIDVFEFWPEDDAWGNYDASLLCKKPNMTIHRTEAGSSSDDQCQVDYLGPDFSQAFHTFTVTWDNYVITWYVDGVAKWRVFRYHDVSSYQGYYCYEITPWNYIVTTTYPQTNTYMNIIANLSVYSTSGPNGPDGSTPFPGAFEIDYIKYWRQKPCGNDLNYTATSQLNLLTYPDVLNVVSGTNITMGTSIVMPINIDVKFEANTKITMLPGFSSPDGSRMIATIDPMTCYKSYTPFSDSSDTPMEEPSVTQGDDPDLGIQFDVFPNPNNGSFVVTASAAEEKNITVHDVLGRLVYEKLRSTETKVEVDISSEPSGIYIVKVVSPGEIWTKKLLKE